VAYRRGIGSSQIKRTFCVVIVGLTTGFTVVAATVDVVLLVVMASFFSTCVEAIGGRGSVSLKSVDMDWYTFTMTSDSDNFEGRRRGAKTLIVSTPFAYFLPDTNDPVV